MPHKKILFVTDFDGTMTEVDTSYLTLRSCHKFIDGTEEYRNEQLKMWKERAILYTDGYQKSYESGFTKINSHGQNTLLELERCLDEYNKDSRFEIARSNLLDDHSARNVEQLVSQIKFYPRALDTLSAIKRSLAAPNHCKVLSVNWFKPLIVEALKDIIEDPKEIVTANVPVLKDDDSVDLGPVFSSVGKKDWIYKWCHEVDYDASIYIGDSLTDLLALVEVDYGIVFGNNVKVFETVNHFGIKMLPLSGVSTKPEKDNNSLYFTEDWSDILKFIQLLQIS